MGILQTSKFPETGDNLWERHLTVSIIILLNSTPSKTPSSERESRAFCRNTFRVVQFSQRCVIQKQVYCIIHSDYAEWSHWYIIRCSVHMQTIAQYVYYQQVHSHVLWGGRCHGITCIFPSPNPIPMKATIRIPGGKPTISTKVWIASCSEG